jgi:putative transposase
MLATKSTSQTYIGADVDCLLQQCLTITYNAINYGKENRITNRKGMKDFYRSLSGIGLPSCYKLGAITRACAVIKSRKKSEKRGVETIHAKPLRPMVCIVSGFFITMKGRLFIPLGSERFFDIQLNRHVEQTLLGRRLRSLTITPNSLSICYSEEIETAPVRTVFGVDRNEKNLTFGNNEIVTQIDLSETVRIKQMTREVVKSFKRNDARVRRRVSSKYWKRANDRTNQLLHTATNFIIENAVKDGAAIALEDLTGMRKMYQKGNYQNRNFRFRLNSWPDRKVWGMLGYKASWKGVNVVQLTKAETYGSSSMHSECGEKLHRPAKGDMLHQRMLWC